MFGQARPFHVRAGRADSLAREGFGVSWKVRIGVGTDPPPHLRSLTKRGVRRTLSPSLAREGFGVSWPSNGTALINNEYLKDFRIPAQLKFAQIYSGRKGLPVKVKCVLTGSIDSIGRTCNLLSCDIQYA